MKVLLLSKVESDKPFFQKIASIAGVSFVEMGTIADLCAALKLGHEDIAVVDIPDTAFYQQLEKALADEVGLFSGFVNPNRFFFVGNGEFTVAPYLAQSDLFGNFIPRSNSAGNEKLIASMFKISTNDSEEVKNSGIDRFFGESAQTQQIEITKSEQKIAVVESLKDQLIKLGFKNRPAAQIATAADEIIMNAIFDAPVDEAGKSKYENTPRSTKIELTGDSVVLFKVAYDGEMLGISVFDRFGSLNRKKLLGHLVQSYEDNAFKVKTNIAGAGLGLANVYRNCGGMIIECELGLWTQVTVLYRRTSSFKEFKDQFRLLSALTYLS